eukprot:CAMPEP_0174729474 /NCGR_PEP_ID=MMETSP1094-20130205/53794_1 /TAXON_ID=156173 /ORGANISM="Chrysochromulina brevifilum, Strain UTEX LB 985" /LENGTH=131 /DNA_ID=CAMNT_0015931595 /DNA_START=145 /DNA_END=540 /DNA_ORIENTATION=+
MGPVASDFISSVRTRQTCTSTPSRPVFRCHQVLAQMLESVLEGGEEPRFMRADLRDSHSRVFARDDFEPFVARAEAVEELADTWQRGEVILLVRDPHGRDAHAVHLLLQPRRILLRGGRRQAAWPQWQELV